MITDPIILAEKYPNKFKIILYYFYYPDIGIGFTSDKYTSVYVSDDGHKTNIDHPHTRLILLSNKAKNYYTFLNSIHFKMHIKYKNKLKAFKTNNSSWAKVKLVNDKRTHMEECRGEIHFSTPLDMMAVCNELFTDMNDAKIYFLIKGYE